MRVTTYDVLQSGVAGRLGWDFENLDRDQFHAIKRCVSQALGECWEEHDWPQLREVKLRRYWPPWNELLTYYATDSVYFPPTSSYYQALQASVAQAPATLVGGLWETNLSYWSEATRALTADAWLATLAYSQGDVVYSTTEYAYYQAHTDSPAGTLVTNTAYWGVITPLVQTIPWVENGFMPIGNVLGVFQQNPLVWRGAAGIPWNEGLDGVQLLGAARAEAWVMWQRRPPILVGDYWDATLTYDVVDLESSITVLPTVMQADYPAFETIPLARAATILGSRADVHVDSNGRPATFWRGADADYADDGENGFADAVGTQFSRIRRE